MGMTEEDTIRALFEGISRRWLLVAATTLVLIATGGGAAGQETGYEEGSGTEVLPLITERVEGAGASEPKVGYWWSNATEPKWTGTDRALEDGLRKTRGRMMRPGGDVRISRIYRTPELSVDNAVALASVVGARRIVVGEVRYHLEESGLLPALDGVRAEADLQILDAASSEPTVVQSFEFERSVYDSDGDGEVLETARSTVGEGVGRLIGRALSSTSGPVGVGGEEPLLVLHDVERGEALNRIRSFIEQLDAIDESRVRWASEGLVALEMNPGEIDDPEAIRYAARALVNHDFDRMTVSDRHGRLAGDFVELGVSLAEGFGRERRESGEDRRGDE